VIVRSPAAGVAARALEASPERRREQAGFWSLAVFGIDLLIIHGLSAYGGQRSRAAA
jgi:hypothetical protein